MADFNFINDIKNKTYEVSESDILKAEQRMKTKFPNDLKQLYLQVGYGFIKGQSVNAINRILGPGSVADIRLREGVFELDPDLEEIYDDEDKLIFFEVNEGVYISIDLNLENNPVFYFDVQIAESLVDFFKKFLNDNEYYVDLI
ncbi:MULTISPECIES: SMI1/KNR4 family protein [Clostridia]|uniref:SMI1/KNR4 family protein n=1 Tax=Clostridia TaxID=186801 RepID=UPI000EA3C485|nr:MULTISPECIES: SMI1/KNR4 family protein [Clostridia]NBJ71660.1 SMI1/KNR4 family protein [Roseburia sp. 1XD42-34]RKI73835.1 SMI1/KNR4 family protein [Clostridium sp. 1xD42-85]